MLRLVEMVSRSSTQIVLRTEELTTADLIAYVVYDTSTGLANMDDYVGWRATTATSTGYDGVYLILDNDALYPNHLNSVDDYTVITLRNLYIMTYTEYTIMTYLLDRVDLVRRRLPDPGYGISSTNQVGEDGTVGYAGGYQKKFAVSELGRFVEGSIIELNWTSPMTSFYPSYMTVTQERETNPYLRNEGIPYPMIDLLTQGSVLKALVAWGIMEVDLSFTTSDSGLSITFDRSSQVSGWWDRLLADYNKQKDMFKMNYYSGPIGVGSIPWSAWGWLATAINNAQSGGALAMSTILGWSVRGSTPL